MLQAPGYTVTAAPGTLSVPGFSLSLGVHPPASVLERHAHEQPTICAVQHGRFTEYYPGKSVSCDATTLKVTPAGEPHWNRFDAVDTRGIRIDVEGPRFAAEPSVARLLDERLFFPAEPFGPLTRGIIRELDRPDEYSRISVEALLLELLATMGRLGASPAPARRQAWLIRADEIVRALYRSHVAVSDIAAEVSVPPATLARAYRRAYGCTIGQRVRQLRMEYAARELTTTSLPLAEIALRAGFYDQSHFSNAFRKHFGATPARYRRWA